MLNSEIEKQHKQIKAQGSRNLPFNKLFSSWDNKSFHCPFFLQKYNSPVFPSQSWMAIYLIFWLLLLKRKSACQWGIINRDIKIPKVKTKTIIPLCNSILGNECGKWYSLRMCLFRTSHEVATEEIKLVNISVSTK